MTKNQLMEYRDLQKEIKWLLKRVEKLQDTNSNRLFDTVTGSYLDFPYSQHQIKIEGFDSKKRNSSIDKLESILAQQVSKSVQKTIDIAEFICKIESVKLRMIFEYRYYDLLTWQQIAYKIGVTDESYPRRLHDKYF